jgi:protein-tyrosine phosphatase
VYVELHFHLLPGVDDGPRSLDESLALARGAVADGTGTVVSTPHIHPEHVTDPTEVRERTAELLEHLRRSSIALEVLPGGELAHPMVARLDTPALEAIAQGPPGRRWLLLESPFSGLDASFTAAADELRARGFAVVVAHPERIEHTQAAASALAHELTAGSVLQTTAASVVGEHGDRVRAVALKLLSAAPRAVIASDAHGAHRPPALGAAVQELSSLGDEDPRRFVSSIPRALLERGLDVRGQALAA